MKEISQRRMFDLLLHEGIKNFVGVPDSTMKHFISQGLKKKKILVATREDEAIGIAAGMSLSKQNSLVFMQNAGFANSISTITSLVQLYEVPIIFLIGWRGYLKKHTIKRDLMLLKNFQILDHSKVNLLLNLHTSHSLFHFPKHQMLFCTEILCNYC